MDDTPITRAPRTTTMALGGGAAGRRLWDSPGFAGRPVTPDWHERGRGSRGDGDGDEDVTMETEGASFMFRACVSGGGADASRLFACLFVCLA